MMNIPALQFGQLRLDPDAVKRLSVFEANNATGDSAAIIEAAIRHPFDHTANLDWRFPHANEHDIVDIVEKKLNQDIVIATDDTKGIEGVTIGLAEHNQPEAEPAHRIFLPLIEGSSRLSNLKSVIAGAIFAYLFQINDPDTSEIRKAVNAFQHSSD